MLGCRVPSYILSWEESRSQYGSNQHTLFLTTYITTLGCSVNNIIYHIELLSNNYG